MASKGLRLFSGASLNDLSVMIAWEGPRRELKLMEVFRSDKTPRWWFASLMMGFRRFRPRNRVYRYNERWCDDRYEEASSIDGVNDEV